MPGAVLDAGVALAWLQGFGPQLPVLDRLMTASRKGSLAVAISVVNLAEVLIHSQDMVRNRGIAPVALLKSCRVAIHSPDEAIANRVASLGIPLADAFAAATAMELGARLHTRDRELAARLKGRRISVTLY